MRKKEKSNGALGCLAGANGQEHRECPLEVPRPLTSFPRAPGFHDGSSAFAYIKLGCSTIGFAAFSGPQ